MQETMGQGQERSSYLREDRLMPKNTMRLSARFLSGSYLSSGPNTVTSSKYLVFNSASVGYGKCK